MIVSKSKSWLLAMASWSFPALRRERKVAQARPARPSLLQSWQQLLEAPTNQFVKQLNDEQ